IVVVIAAGRTAAAAAIAATIVLVVAHETAALVTLAFVARISCHSILHLGCWLQGDGARRSKLCSAPLQGPFSLQEATGQLIRVDAVLRGLGENADPRFLFLGDVMVDLRRQHLYF